MISKLMNEELPLNRKERYYTGTIFPMIVCRDNFKHLEVFTSMIPGYISQPVSGDISDSNIQFFTEYSLKESISGKDKGRFPDNFESKDTPDVLILIKGEQKILIAVEAKMFSNSTAENLFNQMKNQDDIILNVIKNRLHIDRVYHIALIPRGLKDKIPVNIRNRYIIITWEDIYEKYSEIYGKDYFLEVLNIALGSYDDLVSKSAYAFGKNCESKKRGQEIYNMHERGNRETIIMGRNRGLYGDIMNEDIKTGRWRTQTYETSSAEEKPNRNWFFIEDFVALIDKTIAANK